MFRGQQFGLVCFGLVAFSASGFAASPASVSAWVTEEVIFTIGFCRSGIHHLHVTSIQSFVEKPMRSPGELL